MLVGRTKETSVIEAAVSEWCEKTQPRSLCVKGLPGEGGQNAQKFEV